MRSLWFVICVIGLVGIFHRMLGVDTLWVLLDLVSNAGKRCLLVKGFETMGQVPPVLGTDLLGRMGLFAREGAG